MKAYGVIEFKDGMTLMNAQLLSNCTWSGISSPEPALDRAKKLAAENPGKVYGVITVVYTVVASEITVKDGWEPNV